MDQTAVIFHRTLRLDIRRFPCHARRQQVCNLHAPCLIPFMDPSAVTPEISFFTRLSLILYLVLFSVQMSPATPAMITGNVYYVAANGSDVSGDGSVTNPWATITHALENVAAGSEIQVQPGVYNGRVRLRGAFSTPVTVRAAVPYKAILQNDDRVVTAYSEVGGVSGIILEGFEIRHSGPGAAPLVIHVDGGGDDGPDGVHDITLRNNIIHDSYNNDLLKINNAAHDIRVSGNLFYNQSGSDEHIDINSVQNITVEDNIFFNDFAGSGRENTNSTSSYIVIKDSNGGEDAYLGSSTVYVRRNIFLNWEGSTGANFLLIGEDAQPFIEGYDILVENNLMLGNSRNVMRAPIGVKSGEAITFRHNTIAGDLPALAYAMRLNVENPTIVNDAIHFFNNVWTDPTMTMGAEEPSRPNDFSDTPLNETLSFLLDNNLYWNGGANIPEDPSELINYSDDGSALVNDPLLGDQENVLLPRWDPVSELFLDGSSTIRSAFERLVALYGMPASTSPLLNAAREDQAPTDDILGNLRSLPDIGATERIPFEPTHYQYLPFTPHS